MTRADIQRAVKDIRAAATLAEAIDVAIQRLVTPLQAQPPALPASEGSPQELAAIRQVCLDAGMTDASTTLHYIQNVFYAFKRLTTTK